MGNHHWSVYKAAVLAIALAISASVLTLPCAPLWAQEVESAQNSATDQSGPAVDTGGEELILAVSYGPYTLSTGFLAFQREGRYYLPLIELAEMFEFVVEPELDRGIVSGYFRDESRTFSIDTEKGEYEAAGERKPLAPDDYVRDPFGDGYADLFVDIDILNEIWPVDMTVNLSALVMEVATEEKLPFELRLEREEKRAVTEARRRLTPADKKLPFKPNPYRVIGPPVADIETQYSWEDKEDEISGRTTITGTQDFLGTSADYTTSINYDPDKGFQRPESLRLRLTRQSYGDETLPLGLRQVEAGDVRLQHRDLITSSNGGRGVVATSYPARTDNEFDRITVEGTGIPGWEVEVYRNDELIEFGTVDSDGEYRFEDFPLNIGNNQIRVVLYGPQGQVQERIENRRISGGMVKPGQTRYTAGLVDVDRDFVLIEKEERDLIGVGTNAFVARGINDNLTIFGSLTRLPTTDGDKKYATVGAMGPLLGGMAQAEFYKQANGGHATDIRFLTDIKGVRLSLQNALFNDLESPEAGFDNNVRTWESEGRASKTVRTFLGNLGLQLGVRHQESKNALPLTDVTFQTSLNARGLRLNHETSSSYIDYNHQRSSGTLSATVRMQRWEFQSQFNYEMYPEYKSGVWQGDVRYRGSGDDDGFSAAVTAQHNFVNSIYGGGVQLGYDFGKLLSSVDLNWKREEGLSLMLRASTSLGPFGPNGRYVADSEKLSRTAPVAGRVFLDTDGDGVYTPDVDQPLPGARLRVNGGNTREESGDDGRVTVKATGAQDVVNIEVDKTSLEDPYYQPGIEGYSTAPRPGSLPVFDFPVIETGSIDGTAMREDGDPIPGLRIELVNAEGAVVMSTESAYDGFYTFEFVPPGTYTVRADPSYEVNVPPETVSVSSEDLFPAGIDLLLLEQAAEEQAAPVTTVETQPVAVAAAGSGEVAHTHHESSKGTLKPAPLTTEGELSAFVQRVRIGEHPGKVRLVMDLSGPATYRLNEPAGSVVTIDLPAAGWEAIRSWRAISTPVLQGFTVEALPDGAGTRLILTGDGPIRVGLHGILKPSEGGQGHRLYIDLERQ